MVEISDEDFAVIRDALRLACSPYGEDDIERVILAERKALRVIEGYAAT